MDNEGKEERREKNLFLPHLNKAIKFYMKDLLIDSNTYVLQ